MIVLMLLIASVLSGQVLAHPPQDMVLSYDIDTQVLTVTFTHISPAPTVHYINQVDIERNDQLVLSQDYDSQPSTSEFTYTYDIEADVGDELSVTAFCNIQGSISRSIIVRDPSQDDPPVVEIVNPTEGYFHFSGIRLFPSFGIIGNTLGFGGFRLTPLQFYTEDDVDDRSDLTVRVSIDGEELGVATYNSATQVHELQWTGPNLGTFTLSVTAEDSAQNIGSDEMEVWYFCFIP